MSERLSGLEELVLLAVVAAGDDAYGVSIRDRLERAGQPSSLGTVYAALDALQRKRCVSATMSAPTPMRGGRRKKVFLATKHGRTLLASAAQVRRHLRTEAKAAAH
ncbi:MAG: helix-turn-helix transcriptional regulator [Myxococcales bacterium]|nr:helix-turn-helix transcriptional regulator [Myxococcales bacterium]MDD9971165.1 helix-turn-helix transcriptional regulator [Myxococcales bacterium]